MSFKLSSSYSLHNWSLFMRNINTQLFIRFNVKQRLIMTKCDFTCFCFVMFCFTCMTQVNSPSGGKPITVFDLRPLTLHRSHRWLTRKPEVLSSRHLTLEMKQRLRKGESSGRTPPASWEWKSRFTTKSSPDARTHRIQSCSAACIHVPYYTKLAATNNLNIQMKIWIHCMWTLQWIFSAKSTQHLPYITRQATLSPSCGWCCAYPLVTG